MARAIGLDIGTTTLCAVVMDTTTGNLLESATLPNRAALPPTHPWENLQDPAIILQDALALFENLAEKHAPVACVGVTGQMHGILYIDAAGKPASSLATWQDGRGDEPFGKDGAESYAGHLAALSGTALATGYGAVTHYYNVQNGLVPADAAAFCTIGDALAMTLAGRAAPLLHPSNAASLGLFNLQTNAFNTAVIQKAGMDIALFPQVSLQNMPLGETASGIPVMCAIGDNQASFIGSVRDMEHSLLVNMGTGSQISCRTTQCVATPATESRPGAEQDFLWVGSSLCGGRAYALLEQFFRQVAEGAGPAPENMYTWMNKLSEQVFDLADPLAVNTAFSGTRKNPSLRGGIKGLGIHNFTPAHLVCGVLQGTVDELGEMYDGVSPLITQKPTLLVGSGNGLRKSEVWRKLFTRRLGMHMVVPTHREEAAFGAALFALAGAGVTSSLAAAQQFIRYIGE